MKKAYSLILLLSLSLNAWSTTFYFQGGNLNIASTWNDATDGSGTNAVAGDFAVTSNNWDLNGNSGTTPSIFSINGGFLNSGAAVVLDNVDLAFSGSINATGITLANSTNGTSVQYAHASGNIQALPGDYKNLLVLVNPQTITATGNITVGDIELNTGDVLDMAGFTLSIGALNSVLGPTAGATIKTSSTNAALTFTGGATDWKVAIEYTGADNQKVDNTNNFTAGLIISGSDSKLAQGDLTVGSKFIINTGAKLEMSTFNLIESTTSISSISGAGALETKNITTTPFPSGKTWGDIRFIFNAASNSTEYIPSGTYHSVLQIVSTNTLKAGGDITINDELADLAGTVDMLGFKLSGTLSFANFSTPAIFKTANISSDPFPSGLTFGSNTKVSLYAAADQTIPGGTYSDLNIDGTGTKTASGNITVNTLLAFGTSSNSLDMSTYQLLGTPNTLNFSNSHSLSTQNISSTPIPSGETWPQGVLVIFDASADQTIPAGSYDGAIELTGSGTKSASGNITTSGIVFDDITLDMKTFKLIPATGGFTDLAVTGSNPTLRTAFVGSFPIPDGATWTAFNMIFEADGIQRVNVGTCTNLTIGGGTGFNKRKSLSREVDISGTLTINNDCWLESGTNNITDEYQLLGNFTVAGSGSLSTSYLDSPDRIKDPIPQGLDWSSLDQVRYENNAERVAGGTYSKLRLNGSGNNHFTIGNVICDELSTGNEDVEVSPGDYIIGNTLTHTGPGEVIIEADASGYGQLKFTTNAGTSPIRKQFYIDATPSERWVDMSTALVGADLSDLPDAGAKIVFDVEGVGSAFEWDASIANWVQSSATGNNPAHGNRIYLGTRSGGSDIFLRDGSGVVSENATDLQTTSTSRAMYYNTGQNTTATFVGGTDLSDTEGWNFIANPFLANYDWDAARSTLDGLIRNVYYVWNGTNYVSRNLSDLGGAGQYIAPGQGFWIQVEPSWTSGNTFPLDITHADPTGSGSFLKTNNVEDFLSIKVSELNGPYADEVFMQFSPILSDEFDAGFDAVNLINAPNVPNLNIPGKEGKFSTFATSDKNKTYTLNFSDEEDGQHLYFSLNDDALLSHNYVFIEDIKTGTITELTNGGTYEFMNDVNFKSDRFNLHFGKTRSEIPLESGESFFAYLNENNLVVSINTSSLAPVNLSVTDIQGRTVISTQLEMSDEIKVENLILPQGVYVVSISQSGNFLGSQKLIK